MADQYNVAIVGATGAVGTVMLKLLEERDFPVGEVSAAGLCPLDRQERAVSRPGLRRPGAHARQLQRHRHRPVLGRRVPQPRVRALPPSKLARSSSTTRALSAWSRLYLWSSRRSTPTTSSGTRASSPTRTARPSRWSSPSSRSTTRSASSASSSPPSRRCRAPATRRSKSSSARAQSMLQAEELAWHVYPHQIAFNCLPQIDVLPPERLHQGGGEDGQRDAQDHERPADRRDGHLRARARLHRPQRVGQRADPARDQRRRGQAALWPSRRRAAVRRSGRAGIPDAGRRRRARRGLRGPHPQGRFGRALAEPVDSLG